jgi:hypothetical protein
VSLGITGSHMGTDADDLVDADSGRNQRAVPSGFMSPNRYVVWEGGGR